MAIFPASKFHSFSMIHGKSTDPERGTSRCLPVLSFGIKEVSTSVFWPTYIRMVKILRFESIATKSRRNSRTHVCWAKPGQHGVGHS